MTILPDFYEYLHVEKSKDNFPELDYTNMCCVLQNVGVGKIFPWR